MSEAAMTAVARRRFGRCDVALILLALFLAVAVRLAFFGGISSPDELNYLRNAAEWWTGRFELRNAIYLHDTRPLVFVPAAWSFAAFGVSEGTAVLWPFVASILVVVLVYLIALRLFGREAAAYAGLCAALLPLLANEASRLLPGAEINLLLALSTFCFVVSEQVRRRRWIWLGFSGVFFGAVQMGGELGIVLVCMFLAAAVFWRRYGLLAYWPAVAGFAAVTVLNALYYWVEAGDPLFKVNMSRKIVTLVTTVAPHQPLYYARLIVSPFAAHGGVIYLTGIGCVAALVERRREALFVGAWFTLTWLLIEFGSISLTQYQQLSKEVRYFSVVSVPSVIAAGYGLAWMRATVSRRSSRRHRTVAPAVVAGVCVIIAAMSLWTLRSEREQAKEYVANRRTLRDRLRSHEGHPIYVTHCRWNTEVGFFMRFEDAYFPSGYDPYHAVRRETADSTSLNRYVQTLRPGERMGPGLLIQDERFFRASQGKEFSRAVGRGEIPAVLGHTPAEWRLVGRLAVSGSNTVALYEIPEGATWPAPGEQ